MDFRYDSNPNALIGVTAGKVIESEALYPKAPLGGVGFPSIIPGARDGLEFVNLYGRAPLAGLPNAFMAADLQPLNFVGEADDHAVHKAADRVSQKNLYRVSHKQDDGDLLETGRLGAGHGLTPGRNTFAAMDQAVNAATALWA